MTPDEPEQGGPDVTARYQRASAAEGARPSAAVRAAILAEAQRIAAAQAPPEVLKPFDTRTAAVNQGRWKLAAFGTLGVAVLGALLVLPSWRPRPLPRLASAPAPQANAPPSDAMRGAADLRSARPAAELAPRRAPPPAPAEPTVPAAPAQARTGQDEVRRQRSELRALDKSADAARESLAEAAASTRSAAAAPQGYMPSRVPLDGEPREESPLLQAVMGGDMAAATSLLDHGASLDVADDYGHSALFLAVMERRADLVRLLLARGADAARADSTGQTPLLWAQQHHFDDMVQLLTEPLATH